MAETAPAAAPKPATAEPADLESTLTEAQLQDIKYKEEMEKARVEGEKKAQAEAKKAAEEEAKAAASQ